jgi:ketosteroid isomerase-like protein
VSERIELARRALAAFNARDTDALIALFDPQVEIHTRVAGLGEVTIYRGHDGVRSWQVDLNETWDSIRGEPEAFFHLGDQTLMFYVLRGRGRQSGVETSMWFASVTTVRDGLIVSLKVYRDKHEALAELGVSEESWSAIAP